ncbi:hypothetical protein [Paenibacillus endoradicis]|uniref:hypothetical protein n=1 Tax=Paenibacillus endoradicis TaxID=2972487 RepID=UPI002158A4FC|nr:hypothetical protein [Paenibacillus endoradicis]MCR8660489.1 hypothetical protein [Paenibacillus endoradicis]
MSKLKWIGASAILAVGIISGSLIGNALSVGTSSVTPGTVSDPVVTKSYVDEQIAKLSGGGSTGGGTATATLEVVTVPADRILMVNAGSEIVIRTGKAVAYSSDSNGISDVTAGADIKSGVAVPANHEIWFPRDGRGIQAAPGTTGSLTVLVKGSYYLE